MHAYQRASWLIGVALAWSVGWVALLLACTLGVPAAVVAQEASADARARETEQQMTDEERFAVLVSLYPINPIDDQKDSRVPPDAMPSSGYVRGVPRLGVLNLSRESVTAFPSSLALGATFNPALARE